MQGKLFAQTTSGPENWFEILRAIVCVDGKVHLELVSKPTDENIGAVSVPRKYPGGTQAMFVKSLHPCNGSCSSQSIEISEQIEERIWDFLSPQHPAPRG